MHGSCGVAVVLHVGISSGTLGENLQASISLLTDPLPVSFSGGLSCGYDHKAL